MGTASVPMPAARSLMTSRYPGRFWVLTHQDYRAVIRERAAGIGTDAVPTVPPVWCAHAGATGARAGGTVVSAGQQAAFQMPSKCFE